MAYRGKYPNRVCAIYTVTLLGKRCWKIETNNGKRYLFTPKSGKGGWLLPKMGAELATIQETFITIETQN